MHTRPHIRQIRSSCYLFIFFLFERCTLCMCVCALFLIFFKLRYIDSVCIVYAQRFVSFAPTVSIHHGNEYAMRQMNVRDESYGTVNR